MTPGPELVHAIQQQIFKEKKKKIRPPAPIPDNGCPGISNFFTQCVAVTIQVAFCIAKLQRKNLKVNYSLRCVKCYCLKCVPWTNNYVWCHSRI